MRTILFLVICHFVYSSPADDGYIKQKVHEFLYRAALDVIRSKLEAHPTLEKSSTSFMPDDRNETSSLDSRHKRSIGLPSYGLPPVPEIRVSEEAFAHEYVTSTGVGNREQIVLTGIREEMVRISTPSPDNRAFRYARFNSTNYLMSRQSHFISVWHFERVSGGLIFDGRSSVCQIDTRHDGQIVAAEFHTRVIRQMEFLRLAIILNTPSNGLQLRSFDVSQSNCHPVNIFELRRFSLKVSFITSHYESAAVILSEGNSVNPRIDFSQSTGDSGSRIIEVSVKDAVDLKTYTISGQSFMAVANSHGVHIFRLNEFLDRSIVFDHIQIQRVSDISIFQMSFRYFLGIGTSGAEQYLYEWRDGSFHPKQVFGVTGVIQWQLIEIPTCRDDVLVTFLRYDRHSPLDVYVWNGATQSLVRAADDMRKLISFNYELTPHSLASFSFNHTGYLLSLDKLGRPHVLSFHAILAPVTDPVYVNSQTSIGHMKNLHSRFLHQEKFVRDLKGSLHYAIKPYGSVELKQESHFRDVTSRRPVVMMYMSGTPTVKFEGSLLTLRDFNIRSSDMKKGLSRLSSSLSGIQYQMSHIAFKNQPTQMLGQNSLFGAVAYQITSSFLTMKRINGDDVKRLLDNTFMTNTPAVLFGKIFFDNIRTSGHVTGVINGISIRNAVVTNRNQKLITPVSFQNFRVRENLNLRILNHLDVSDLIYLDGADTIMGSPIDIMSPHTIFDATTISRISGVDINSLIGSVLLTVGNQTVSSPLIFQNSVGVKNIMRNTLTDGYSLPELAADIVRYDQPSYIYSNKVFTGYMDIKNKLHVNGTIGGIHIPHNLFLASKSQVVTGTKRMKGQTQFDSHVTVKQSLDGLRLPQDILSLTGQEMVPHVHFRRGIDVFESVAVSGRVDGVDVSDMAAKSVRGVAGKLFHPIINGPVMIRGSLDVSGTINGLTLRHVANDVVLRGLGPVHITGLKRLRQPLFSPELLINTVNGLSLTQLATTKLPETISHVIFRNVVLNRTQVKNAQINDVNLMNLYLSRISLSNPSFIVGGKNFVNQLRIQREFSVRGSVDGIFPNRDLILKGTNQYITGHKRFMKSVHMDGALTINGRLDTLGYIDGVNLTHINVMRVTLNTQQISRISAALVSCRSKSLVSPNINGLNMRSFIPNIMLRYGHQVITGPKTFSYPTKVFGDVKSERGVNAVHLKVLSQEAFRLKGNNLISSPFEFADMIQIESRGVSVYGLINGVDLNYLAADSLMKKGRAILNGVNILVNGFTVTSDVSVNRVNGMILPSSLLLKYGQQTITGHLVLQKTVRSAKNIDLSGTVNGIKLSLLDKMIMKTNRPNMVRSYLSFSSHVNIMGDLRTGGLINGVHVSKMAQTSLLKIFDQVITAPKRFMAASLVSGPNILITNLNGFSLSGMIKEMIFINRRSAVELNSHKILSRGIKINRNLVHRNRYVYSSAEINGIHLDVLKNAAIPLNAPSVLSGTKIFENPLVISFGVIRVFRRINGVDVQKDVMFSRPHPVRSTQVVNGRKTFLEVKSDQSVMIKGLLNKVNLPSLAGDTLYIRGKQYISGRKVLRGQVSGQRDVNPHRLNSMQDFKSELITLHGDQTLEGQVTFLNFLMVVNDAYVRGLVSGKNMTDLIVNSLYHDAPQIVYAPLTFDRIIFNQDVAIAGPVSGVDLSLLAHDIYNFRNTLKMNEMMLKSVMTNQFRKSSHSYDLMTGNPLKIEGFFRKQELLNVNGKYFEESPTGVTFIRDEERSGYGGSTYQLNYRPDLNRFEGRQMNIRTHFVERKHFRLEKTLFTIVRPSVDSDSKTVINAGYRRVATMDSFVDALQIQVRDTSVVISLLIGIKGHVKVYELKSSAGKYKLTNIAVLNVGVGQY